jgi:hypothetical protein
MCQATHKAKELTTRVTFRSTLCGLLLLSSFVLVAALPVQPDASTIVQRSVEALKLDWQAEHRYDYRERDVKGRGSRTYRVMMVLGSPYSRLEAVDGMPLSPKGRQKEQQKLDTAIAERCGESTAQTQKRIDNYNRGRERDHLLMQEITNAFVFKLLGETTAGGRDAWLLQASPKPGYQPPNKQAKVLTGMQGELWIDKDAFQWIKVEAQVIHPVSIEGFLAKVEPGTRFKLVEAPVPGGAWFPSKFSFGSKVRVLSFIGHNAMEDETYFDYQTADSVKIPLCPAGAPR